MNQSLGEDWNQMPPQSQGFLGTSAPLVHDLSFLGKGLATPLPPITEEQEQVVHGEGLGQR